MEKTIDRQKLEKKRQELLARLEKIRADFASGLDRDSEERAIELENAEVLNEIARITEEELAKVESSLNELDG